jgi:ketopantoate reductase
LKIIIVGAGAIGRFFGGLLGDGGHEEAPVNLNAETGSGISV